MAMTEDGDAPSCFIVKLWGASQTSVRAEVFFVQAKDKDKKATYLLGIREEGAKDVSDVGSLGADEAIQPLISRTLGASYETSSDSRTNSEGSGESSSEVVETPAFANGHSWAKRFKGDLQDPRLWRLELQLDDRLMCRVLNLSLPAASTLSAEKMGKKYFSHWLTPDETKNFQREVHQASSMCVASHLALPLRVPVSPLPSLGAWGEAAIIVFDHEPVANEDGTMGSIHLLGNSQQGFRQRTSHATNEHRHFLGPLNRIQEPNHDHELRSEPTISGQFKRCL